MIETFRTVPEPSDEQPAQKEIASLTGQTCEHGLSLMTPYCAGCLVEADEAEDARQQSAAFPVYFDGQSIFCFDCYCALADETTAATCFLDAEHLAQLRAVVTIEPPDQCWNCSRRIPGEVS